VLMLCTDGLSDHQQVEASWASYVGLVVNKIVSLSAAVESWIELANQRNGHDNVAVALMSVDMSDTSAAFAQDGSESDGGQLATRAAAGGEIVVDSTVAIPQPPGQQPNSLTDQMTPASRALLYGEDEGDDTPLTAEEMAAVSAEEEKGTRSVWQRLVTIVLGLIILGALGVGGWLLWQSFQTPTPLPPDSETSERPVL